MSYNRVTAIIVAGGSGSRMKKNVNKILLTIKHQSILEMTLSKFELSKLVDNIILVINKNDIKDIYNVLSISNSTIGSFNDAMVDHHVVDSKKFTKLHTIVIGGNTRTQSVYNGLIASDISTSNDMNEYVLIHDAARPFILSAQIDKFITQLFDKKNLVMAIPAFDTIKQVNDGIITKSLDRNYLYQIQTPQGFEKEKLIQAYKKAKKEHYEATDDSSIMEWMGYQVSVYTGSRDNIKITVKEDLEWLKFLLSKKDMR